MNFNVNSSFKQAESRMAILTDRIKQLKQPLIEGGSSLMLKNLPKKVSFIADWLLMDEFKNLKSKFHWEIAYYSLMLLEGK